MTEYRFTNVQGGPFTDPNYSFFVRAEGAPDLLVRGQGEEALVRTVLDGSGKAVEVTVTPVGLGTGQIRVDSRD